MRDKNDIERFVDAQNSPYGGYAVALQEMKDGQKCSHWIWYIFPQLRGLGRSFNSDYYGLADKDEAKRYLEHPVLGPRLREITKAVLSHKGQVSLQHLMGSSIDVIKLKSCMQLFDEICPQDDFAKVLNFEN